MFDLTSLERDLLRIVAGTGRSYRVEMRAELEKYYQCELEPGCLVPRLETLVRAGVVERRSLDGQTEFYTVTARGKRQLRAFHRWEVDVLSRRTAVEEYSSV